MMPWKPQFQKPFLREFLPETPSSVAMVFDEEMLMLNAIWHRPSKRVKLCVARTWPDVTGHEGNVD